MEPQEVFDIFAQICRIPRPSKHEQQMSQWLVDFAASHGISCVQDKALNVIMRVPATPGYEDHEGVILQAHMDMVCEKNNDVTHDFLHDPILTYVEDDFLHAQGTTLGGDDGIGVSMALAALTSPTLRHPALEALFTVDEETGLTGAFLLQDGYLHARQLINLDSEDDGQIFIGCAGGIDTLAKMHYDLVPLPAGLFAFRVAVTGLMGGHSGDDINKGRANANKLIVSFLQRVPQYFLIQLQGGNLRNAIAREAEAIFAVPKHLKHEVVSLFNTYLSEVESQFDQVEKSLSLTLDSCALPLQGLPYDRSHALIDALVACPHGMIAMTPDMPDLVQTSTNLASIKMKSEEDDRLYIEINTSQRSSIEEDKHAIKLQVEQALATACDEVTHGDGYPGWAPNVHSPLLTKTKQAYIDLFHAEPKVLAIHAGLECGLFLQKYPYLDMVSIGPQMYGVHSPQERLSISSTARCWRWLQHVIEML